MSLKYHYQREEGLDFTEEGRGALPNLPAEQQLRIHGSVDRAKMEARKKSSSAGSTNGGGEARMLERRVSNNRADLNGDQRMNYFLSWFQVWSDLQKSDFVTILADKMSDGGQGSVADDLDSMKINGDQGTGKKPPSLYECQIKLFKDWFSSWSDDQKNYLVTRLQAIDAEFYEKYAAAEAKAPPVKDYFEPGVPPELVRKSSRSVLGPHAATFNAHQILPADQPKSFIHTGSSNQLTNSGSLGSGDSLGASSNNSGHSEEDVGCNVAEEDSEPDSAKTTHTTSPADTGNLSTIVE